MRKSPPNKLEMLCRVRQWWLVAPPPLSGTAGDALFIALEENYLTV